MRLPLPVLTVMAVSRGNLPETVGPRRWVHCVLFDFEKQERSAGFTESHPGATPPVSSRADATGMQAPYPGQCAHPSGHHGPPGFSFLRPRAGLHSLNGLPRPPTHLRGRMVRSQHLTMRPKGRGRVPRPWAGRCDQPLFYVPPKTDREAAGNDFVVPLIFSNVFHLIHP